MQELLLKLISGFNRLCQYWLIPVKLIQDAWSLALPSSCPGMPKKGKELVGIVLPLYSFLLMERLVAFFRVAKKSPPRVNFELGEQTGQARNVIQVLIQSQYHSHFE